MGRRWVAQPSKVAAVILSAAMIAFAVPLVILSLAELGKPGAIPRGLHIDLFAGLVLLATGVGVAVKVVRSSDH